MKKILLFALALFYLGSGQAAVQEKTTAEKQRTLSIIKPDAVRSGHIGDIVTRFEKEGFTIVSAKMTRLSQDQAEKFYLVHKDRPFYATLVQFMSSGPIFVQVLEGNNAVMRNRQIMGATNPKDAAPGTLRAQFGVDVEKNAVHGSDSLENAKQEIAFFFSEEEIFSE